MSAIGQDLDAVAPFPRQLQVADPKCGEDRNVPAERQILRDSGSNVAMNLQQLRPILVQDSHVDGMFPVCLGSVEKEPDQHACVQGGGQLLDLDGVDAPSEHVGKSVPYLHGFGKHRPIELHQHDSNEGRNVGRRSAEE